MILRHHNFCLQVILRHIIGQILSYESICEFGRCTSSNTQWLPLTDHHIVVGVVRCVIDAATEQVLSDQSLRSLHTDVPQSHTSGRCFEAENNSDKIAFSHEDRLGYTLSLLLWPWPWPDDPETGIRPKHPKDVPAHCSQQTSSKYVNAFLVYSGPRERVRWLHIMAS